MTNKDGETRKSTTPHGSWPLPRRPRLPGTTCLPGLSAARTRDTNATNNARTDTVTDPQIVCPTCRTEIKLTESLAAPLIAETRRQFEHQLAAKEADFGRREAQLKRAQDEVTKAREAIDEQVAGKLKAERAAIAETKATRARHASAAEIASVADIIIGMMTCPPVRVRCAFLRIPGLFLCWP